MTGVIGVTGLTGVEEEKEEEKFLQTDQSEVVQEVLADLKMIL